MAVNNKNLRGVLVAGMLLVSVVAQAKEILRVQVPAVFDGQASVEPAIRDECAADMILGNHVFQKVADKFPDSLQVQDATKMQKGKVLKLTILSIQGIGGGGWTGPKTMTVRADLLQDGEVVQTVVKREHSRGGVWGIMRGTCSIVEVVTESLGRQFAAWLVKLDASEVAGTVSPSTAVPVTPLGAPAAKNSQNGQTKQIADAAETNMQPEP
jgi:hypothetical protein